MNSALAFFTSQIGKDSLKSPSPLMRWFNPTLLSAAEGTLEFSYVVREEMTNPMRIMHGGATAAIIDDTMGATVFSLGNTHLYTTVNLAVDYFSTAKKDDVIIAKTAIVKKGSQIINAECEIWNADKTRLIAKGYSNLLKTKIEQAAGTIPS
ncbi:MAG: PaaI family thioesterase [Bacteroidota bacterium]